MESVTAERADQMTPEERRFALATILRMQRWLDRDTGVFESVEEMYEHALCVLLDAAMISYLMEFERAWERRLGEPDWGLEQDAAELAGPKTRNLLGLQFLDPRMGSQGGAA